MGIFLTRYENVANINKDLLSISEEQFSTKLFTITIFGVYFKENKYLVANTKISKTVPLSLAIQKYLLRRLEIQIKREFYGKSCQTLFLISLL